VLLTSEGRKLAGRGADRVSQEIEALAQELSPADRKKLIASIGRMLFSDPQGTA
jgi:hypothetical protein